MKLSMLVLASAIINNAYFSCLFFVTHNAKYKDFNEHKVLMLKADGMNSEESVCNKNFVEVEKHADIFFNS